MTKTVAEKYDYINIPERDKERLIPYKNKHDFINALPKIIQDHLNDYDIYFLTITFKKVPTMLSYRIYEEFFFHFRKNLERYLLSDRRHDFTKPKLILVPEKLPDLHFHGFLMIHKMTNDKFQKKFILKVENEHVASLDTMKKSIRFYHKRLNPYPKTLNFQKMRALFALAYEPHERTIKQKRFIHEAKTLLNVHTYKMYKIHSDHECEIVSKYSCKKFLQSSFSIDQIILEVKLKTQI